MGKEIQGISVSSPHEQLSFGDVYLKLSIEHLILNSHPNAFLQNHQNQSRNIYLMLRDLIQASSPKILLDLYSGIGITSLLAAHFIQTIYAVESNAYAGQFAKMNAKANGIQNVTFLTEPVEKAAAQLMRKKPEMAVVNPPRVGLSKTAAEMLATSSLKKILYVSCHPASLRRDLIILKRQGFHLSHVQAFDMFPQTGHLESLVVLER